MTTHLIASILTQLGFITHVTQFGVIVSLNRPVNTLEIEIALAQEFEGIRFNVSRVSQNQVMVQE